MFWNRKKFAYKLHTNGDRHFTICTKKIAHALIILRFLLAYIRVYFFYTKCYISERANSTTKSARVKIYFLLRCVLIKKKFSQQLSGYLAKEFFFSLLLVLIFFFTDIVSIISPLVFELSALCFIINEYIVSIRSTILVRKQII